MFLIPQEDYEVRQTAKTGRGIYARRELPPGIIIGDYLGKLIDADEIDANEDHYHRELYYVLINEKQAVLPIREDEGVHLINHSCEPNIAFVPHDGHMLFATLRRIFPGEELTMNYLIDPSFGERNYFVCHCGSPVCNGTQYIHPNKIVQFEKMFAESASRQSDEEKRLPFGATLPPLKTYPTHFTDDPFYDLFGSSTHPPTVLPHDTVVPALHALRKLLRESGTHLAFPAIKITVCGIMDDLIISTSI